MTKNEFVGKVENGSEIMFKIGSRGFTIFSYSSGDVDIGEWGKSNTVRKFPDVESLLNKYNVNGKPLKESVGLIKITDYS